ncbi:hypothetical protein [Streptomyces demainii]|uniref:DUF3375 domain-containing protein n=1 Tax=Streptomyces demainii TaxID=588122 RepID=A0ABT9KWS5_9ACTN|nr:hypothetical protein [Streptomyces demainii]MDP9612881.1 hypothetical protein [Streptomyces demainii]
MDSEERQLLTVAPEHGADSSWISLVTDPGFVRRSAVLARSSPLHRLDLRQAWQQFPAGLYDPRTLALAALEAVMHHQGLDQEATTEAIVDFLVELARRAAPDRDGSEHSAVARFVLRELLNDQEGGVEFAVPYSDYRDGHCRQELGLRLLAEEIGQDGRAVLRASVPAINLLLAGMDIDVEDQQAAQDEILRRQVRTGRWGRAEESAGESLKLSLAYAERLRVVLRETERDVRAVDWGCQVPELLDSSRSHLIERQRAELGLIELMRKARDGIEESDVLLTCMRILQLLERARHRHTQLLKEVLGARSTFLRSQAQQRFRPIPDLARVSMQGDVLVPLLELGAEEAAGVTGVFTDALCGPVVARLPRLRDWWSLLLAPVREASGTFEDDEVVELTDDDLVADAAGHSDLDYAQARSVLSGALVGPVRLSQLVADALRFGPSVADVVALAVLAAFAPDPESDDEVAVHDLSDLLGERLVVLDDGQCFGEGPYGGNDLLIVPVQALIGECPHEEAAA